MTEFNDNTVISNFEAAVKTAMGTGLTRPQAVKDVVTKQPRLHRRYLLECNSSRPRAQSAILETFDRDLQQARSAAAPKGRDPIAVWDGLVEGYVKSCGNRQKATSRAVREHPEAHREMLVAYNAQHGRPCGV